MPSDLKKIPALDGIRGIAILMVLVWHSLPCQLAGPFVPGTWQARVMKYLNSTWSGVDLFFVLSGFLIFRLFLNNNFSLRYLGSFYIRRAFRILPLYWLLLISFFVATKSFGDRPAFAWLFNSPMPAWSYWALVQNWFMGNFGDFGARWLGITWSLAVEEQFYLLAPLIFLLFRSFRNPWILMFLALLPPFFRTGVSGLHGFVETFYRLDSFLLGAFASCLIFFPKSSAFISRHTWLFAGATFLSLALILYQRFHPFFRFWGWYDEHLVHGIFYFFLIVFSTGCETAVSKALSHITLRSFGNISYGLYLFHELVAGLLHGAFFSRRPLITDSASLAVTCLGLVVSVLLAKIFHRLIEEPAILLGRKLSSRMIFHGLKKITLRNLADKEYPGCRV